MFPQTSFFMFRFCTPACLLMMHQEDPWMEIGAKRVFGVELLSVQSQQLDHSYPGGLERSDLGAGKQ